MNEYPHEYDKIKFLLAKNIENTSLEYNNYEPLYFSGYMGLSISNNYNQQDFPESLPVYLNENYKQNFKSSFTMKFNIKETGNYNGKFYVCKKELDIKAFKDIKIEVKERNFNFTLSYDNLFYEYNNKYYFLIVSGSSSMNNVFTVGSVLMKKYDFVFDKYNSNIGFYDKSIEIKEDPDHTFIIYISIISVLTVLIILVIIYLIWKYMNKPRISRKNELNDEYNYVSGPISDDTK